MEINLIAMISVVVAYGMIASLSYWFFRRGKKCASEKGNFTFRAIMSLFWYSLGVISSVLMVALIPMIPEHYNNSINMIERYDAIGDEFVKKIATKENSENSELKVND